MDVFQVHQQLLTDYEAFTAAPCPRAATSQATGWRSGFHCVVGNPPWERVKLQDPNHPAYHWCT